MVSLARCSTAIAFFAALAVSTVQGQDVSPCDLPVRDDFTFQAKMLAAVNAERAKNGLAAMCTNKKLQKAAQLHSEDMANKNFMGHTGSNGSKFADRITAQGFNWNGAAENVAAGQTDVASVMNSWMTSAGHRANIMGNSKFFGTGYAFSASSTYKHYWTQDFASGAGEACDSDGAATPPTTAPTKAPTKAPTPPPTKAPAATTKAPAVATRPPTAAPTKAPTRPPTTQPPVQQSPRPALRTPTPTSRPTMAPSSTKKPSPKIPKTDCKPIY
ncbi:hypothetical protein PybrP1_010257 [[Pythium] brassicae (nom. inval.)]|nr:hypothetical protein PybrP1_010257 [[Pythium] brassicae (nom. inval.)]